MMRARINQARSTISAKLHAASLRGTPGEHEVLYYAQASSYAAHGDHSEAKILYIVSERYGYT